MRPFLWMLCALLCGCALSSHPEALDTQARPAPTSWDAVLTVPGVVEHEVAVSARWQVPLKGLVDLKDPQAAHLDNETSTTS